MREPQINYYQGQLRGVQERIHSMGGGELRNYIVGNQWIGDKDPDPFNQSLLESHPSLIVPVWSTSHLPLQVDGKTHMPFSKFYIPAHLFSGYYDSGAIAKDDPSLRPSDLVMRIPPQFWRISEDIQPLYSRIVVLVDDYAFRPIVHALLSRHLRIGDPSDFRYCDGVGDFNAGERLRNSEARIVVDAMRPEYTRWPYFSNGLDALVKRGARVVEFNRWNRPENTEAAALALGSVIAERRSRNESRKGYGVMSISNNTVTWNPYG